jgi:hypothetical protein
LTENRFSATKALHTKYGKNKDMKTKALLAAGLLMAASAASSLAQTVYSVNSVGFVNVNFPSGFSIASNPLDGAANTVVALFPASTPNGSTVFKFNPAGGNFTSATFFFGTWDNPTMTLVPGEGFFFRNTAATTFTNTFVGNVKQGTLVTPLSAGFNLVSSQVPQGGLASTDLTLPVGNGDTLFVFRSNAYVSSTFFFGTWDNTTAFPPSGEPAIGVGEGFFVRRSSSGSWTRSFTVNQ